MVTLGEARFSLGAGAGTKATADHSHALHTGRATAPPQRTLRLDLLFGATALTLFFLVIYQKSPLLNGGVGVLRWPCLNASVRW